MVENYISKKNKLKNVDDHSNVDRFVLGKFLNNTLSDEDFKNFYDLSKNIIIDIQQRLLKHLTPFKLAYEEAAIIEDHNYELLHNFLEEKISIDLKGKLLAYCNKNNNKKLLGLERNKDYSSLGYAVLIEDLRQSIKDDAHQILSNHCKTIFKDGLATIKPNTKSAQQFLTKELKFKYNADLILYSKQIDSINDLLQTPEKPRNPAAKEPTNLSKIQELATKIYIEQLNDQNKLLSNYLEPLRPNKLYLEDGEQGSEFLSNFKLDHRIMRNKIKAAGISGQGDTITHNVDIKQVEGNTPPYSYQVSEINRIFGTGSRSDEVGFAPGEGSYSKITEYLQNSDINGSDLARAIQSILKTGTAQDFKDEKYIGQLTYLLFRCEPERNASAFLTNAMFLELLENGMYTIEDIPSKIPMAMSEAVDATRSLLDQLGGKYGEDSPYLTKRQFYDFKDGDVGKAQELAARDTIIFLDWLNLKINGRLNLDHDVITSDKNSSIKLKYFLTQKDDTREAKPLDNFLKIKKEEDRANKRIDLTKHSNKTILDFADSLNSFVKDLLNGVLEQPKDKPMQIDTGSVSDSKPETSADEIFRAFHNLVYEWYGIRLEWLYSKANFENDDNTKKIFIQKEQRSLKSKIHEIFTKYDIQSLSIEVTEHPYHKGTKETIHYHKDKGNYYFHKDWSKDDTVTLTDIFKRCELDSNCSKTQTDLEQLIDNLEINTSSNEYKTFVEKEWNSQITYSSDKKSGGNLFKAQGDDKTSAQFQEICDILKNYHREDLALKYWQSKYNKNENDQSVKNLLMNSAEHEESLINILKEGKIKDISTPDRSAIIQYLDKVIRINISKYLVDIFLNNPNSTNLRETLLNKLSEHDLTIIKLKLRPDTEHQDATEFLESLYFNAFGTYNTEISTTCKNLSDKGLYHETQRIKEQTAIIQLEINKSAKFSQLFDAFNRSEDMTGENQVELESKVDNKPVKIDAVRTTKIIIPENRQEICFSIKRFEHFNGVSKKIKDPIECDQIKVNNRDYEITAFIHHHGELQNGHYITYIKENDGKWYCYNDATRNEVINNTSLNTAKKEAYVVKYSEKDDPSLLPNKQEGIKNDTGARCWLNSSVIFTKSFTTLKKNLTHFIKENENISQDSELLKCINPQKPLNIQEVFSSGDIKTKDAYKGISDTKEGLNLESIKLNLATIIISNLNNIDFYIAPNLISEEELILKFNNWKMTTSSHYGALIGIEDKFGSKHAILLHASRTKGNLIKITLTDPLAEQDSVFNGSLP